MNQTSIENLIRVRVGRSRPLVKKVRFSEWWTFFRYASSVDH